jgi:hypothetical protein
VKLSLISPVLSLFIICEGLDGGCCVGNSGFASWRGSSPRVSKGSNLNREYMPRAKGSEPSLTVGLLPRVSMRAALGASGVWKSDVGVEGRRLPAEIGLFSAILVVLAVAKMRLGTAKTHLAVAKTRLGIAKMQLGTAKTRLAVAKTHLGNPRGRLAVLRMRFRFAKTQLGNLGRQFSEARKRLGGSRSQLKNAKGRFGLVRIAFITTQKLLINPRIRLFIPQFELRSSRREVIIRKRVLVLLRARLSGAPVRFNLQPGRVRSSLWSGGSALAQTLTPQLRRIEDE